MVPADTQTSLARAFEALGGRGILTRQNSWCCQTCADAAISGERDDSRIWRGYVYFTEQDTDDVLERRATFLAYGAFVGAFLERSTWDALSIREKDAAYETIVRSLVLEEIIPVLERFQIVVEWNGDLGTRLLLDNVDFYARV